MKGPISLDRCVLPEQLSLYGKHRGAYDMRAVADGRHVNTISQVPPLARHFMRYLNRSGMRTSSNLQGKWEPVWPAKLVDGLVHKAERNDTRVTPDDYPYAASQFYRALERHDIDGKHVVVAGSISPWLEAIALSRRAASVTSIDYISPRTDSDRIRVLQMSDLARGSVRVSADAIFSYSSIEHDGLGRYGDPIHPLGDVAALGEFAMLLKPGGLLYLGLPVGLQGYAGQGNRIYDAARFAQLTQGWELIATHSAKPTCICGNHPMHYSKNGSPYCCRNLSVPTRLTTWDGASFWERLDGVGNDHWTNQPLFILRRTSGSLRAALRQVDNATTRRGQPLEAAAVEDDDEHVVAPSR